MIDAAYAFLVCMTTTQAAARFMEMTAPHVTRLHRIGLRLTHRADEAEDLVQETLTRAWTHWHRFEEQGSVGGWLSRILVNTFISRHRHHKVVAATHDRADVLEHLYEPARLRGQDRPDHAQEHGCFSRPVMAALSELPEHYRRAIELVDLEGLAYRDAAIEMGVPVGTVMSRLHRARRILRESLHTVADDYGIRTDLAASHEAAPQGRELLAA